MPTRRSSSGDGGASPPTYSSATDSNERAEMRRQQFERQISETQIRLRTGSTGHKPLKNEDQDMADEEHEPIEVLLICISFCF